MYASINEFQTKELLHFIDCKSQQYQLNLYLKYIEKKSGDVKHVLL